MFVERIGFGCARLNSTNDDSVKILNMCYDGGIKYFDTAPMYGNSEEILGKIFYDRSDIFIYTKFGMQSKKLNIIESIENKLVAIRSKIDKRYDISFKSRGNFNENLIRDSIDNSKNKLKRDFLDGLILHEPRFGDPNLVVDILLKNLLLSGEVKSIGVGTGSSLNVLPDYGNFFQCSAWGINSKLINEGKKYILHGIARGVDEKVVEYFKYMRQKNEVFCSFFNSTDDIVAAIAVSYLIAFSNVGILYSTKSTERLNLFLSSVKEFENKYLDFHNLNNACKEFVDLISCLKLRH